MAGKFGSVHFIKATGMALDPESEIPLHRQLITVFRDAIATGTLQPGERVLSSRELRSHFGVSRNTAVSALSELQSEGYLVTVQGSGTFVADARDRQIDAPREPDATNAAVPFRPGIPDLEYFPLALFKGMDPAAPDDDRLSVAIAQRLQQTRGVVCSPEQVLIVPSALYALTLVGRALLRSGEGVVVEDPGSPDNRAALEALGLHVLPAPVDDEGIDVRAFANRPAALACVTPTHQYPTGAPLSLERRVALLDWALKCGAWIVENDYDSEFNYVRPPQPALQSLDERHRVFYVGTFGRTLAPSIRVAYVVVPRALCATLKAAHERIGGYVSPILQAAIATFMERGHFARYVAKMRTVYDERRRFLSSALSDAGLQVRDWGAGLHFTADVPEGLPDRQLSMRASERGIDVPPLSSYFHSRSTMNGLILGFAATPIPAAKIAVKSLLKAL